MEAGRIVIVELGNQAKKEAEGMSGLGRRFSRRKGEDCDASYLVEGRCGFQEVHWEVLCD